MSGLYFDTAYVLKCYLREPDADAVRQTARSSTELCTSTFTIAELACAFQRHLREGTLTPTAAAHFGLKGRSVRAGAEVIKLM